MTKKILKQAGFTLAISLALGWLLVLTLGATQFVSAGGGCVNAYIVQRGDTLMEIARQLGVSHGELLDANRDRIAHPDWIYIGQALCVPGSAGAGMIPSRQATGSARTGASNAVGPRSDSQVVLEIWYQYQPSNEEITLELARSGVLVKRVGFRLLPAEPVVVFTETREISQALTAVANPVIVGMRNRDAAGQIAPDYTLVAIGDENLFARLTLSETIAITPSTASNRARSLLEWFRQPDVEPTGLFFMAEAGDGVAMPFDVTKLDVVPDYARFKQFYLEKTDLTSVREKADDVGFVLFAHGDDLYQLRLRLSPEGYGPPSWTTKVRCNSWQGRGRWFAFFSGFSGCAGW